MRDLIAKIVASVIAGIILWFLTNHYLIKKGTTDSTLLPGSKPESTQYPSRPLNQHSQGAPLKEQNQGTSDAQVSRQAINSAGPDSSSLELQPAVEKEESATPAHQPAEAKIKPPTVEKELGHDVQEARTKADALVKNDTLKTKVKEVRKKANDVFDELDRETEKDTVPE